MRTMTPLLLTFVLCVTLIVACATEGPVSVREGNESFESEDYQQAQEAYERALESMPANPEATYNNANALYKQESYQAAQSGYEQVLEDAAQPDLSQDATFNYARSLHEFARSVQEEGDAFGSSQAYEKAKDAYKQALRLRPDDRQAKYYLERAIEESERNTEEPEQEQQEQEEQEQEEGQEEGQQEDQEQTGQGEQEQQQQPTPQDQQQPQDQQEQDSNQDDSSEEAQPEEGDSSSTQSPSNPGEVPPTGMTEEQAEQLLESIADNTETLRGRIMSERILNIPAEREW